MWPLRRQRDIRARVSGPRRADGMGKERWGVALPLMSAHGGDRGSRARKRRWRPGGPAAGADRVRASARSRGPRSRHCKARQLPDSLRDPDPCRVACLGAATQPGIARGRSEVPPPVLPAEDVARRRQPPNTEPPCRYANRFRRSPWASAKRMANLPRARARFVASAVPRRSSASESAMRHEGTLRRCSV